MKIEIYSTSQNRIIKPGRLSSRGSSSFLTDIQEESTATSLHELPSLNALFTLQENISHSGAFQKADHLLDVLDNLRKDILLGLPSLPDLKEIERLAQNLHNETEDERLKEILLEIETRAVVELAKRSMAT